LAVARIEVSQKSGGKLLTIDLPAQRYRERRGPFAKLDREIVAALVHVNSDPNHSQVRRIVLCAHLDKHARHLLPIKPNVIGQFDQRREIELAADHDRDRFNRPDREPSRVAKLDPGS
jgi:hypothetical protein